MSRSAVLDDAQWTRIEPLMPSSQGHRGRLFRDHRQVIEGIVYRFRTGIALRRSPAPSVVSPLATEGRRTRGWA